MKTDSWRAGVRDWRVWGLTLTIGLPGFPAIAKYAPWPIATGILFLVLQALMHVAWLHVGLSNRICRAIPPRWLLAFGIGALTVVSVAMYPRVNALKELGRGSDRDDALIQTSRRMLSGQRSIYVATYLGNPPSVGPGWALLVSPLAATGAYVMLTPLACSILVWLVWRQGSDRVGTGDLAVGELFCRWRSHRSSRRSQFNCRSRQIAQCGIL